MIILAAYKTLKEKCFLQKLAKEKDKKADDKKLKKDGHLNKRNFILNRNLAGIKNNFYKQH